MEWYEDDGVTKLVPVTGVAILKKGRGNASVSRVLNVAIGIKQQRKGYELKPGIQSSSRRIKVNGGDINDIPCQYCIVGLEKYELPVIGELAFYVLPVLTRLIVRAWNNKALFLQERTWTLALFPASTTASVRPAAAVIYSRVAAFSSSRSAWAMANVSPSSLTLLTPLKTTSGPTLIQKASAWNPAPSILA